MVWIILILLCLGMLILASLIEVIAGVMPAKSFWLLAPIGLVLGIAIGLG